MKKALLLVLLLAYNLSGRCQAADANQVAKLSAPTPGAIFLSRLTAGITFQAQSQRGLLLDVNPMLSYHISRKISFGAGWNYRLQLGHGHRGARGGGVYGPRIAFQYNVRRSISLRVVPELMNTRMTPMSIPGNMADHRQYWIGGIFTGIKGDLKIYKSVRGNAEGLYNLLDQGSRSPYRDQLVLRIGFEFPL